MLDTNILIYLMTDRNPRVAERIALLAADDSLCMSFVTHAELLIGAEGSTRKAEVVRQIDTLVRKVPVRYPGDARISERFAQHFSRLKRAGRPVGNNDLWIASHALADDATIVTNNVTEFARIEGLQLENWAA